MDKKNLFTLVKNGLEPVVSTDFSTEDANSAAVNAICEYFGINENSTTRDIRAIAPAAFALIEEVVDEMLPARLTNVLGAFAEVKQFARDAEVIFKLNKLGKARARLSITKGARGGIYRAARLDSANFQVPTEVYTVAVFVTLEDILLGTYTLGELWTNILEGFEEIVYKQTINALTHANAAVSHGSNRKTVGTAGLTLNAALDDAIARVKQYGTPIVMGFNSQLAKLQNNIATTYVPNVAQQDLDDVRNIGHITLYKGTRIVEIPNYLVDETTTSGWILDDQYIYVIPTDAKPVKVALKGELHIEQNPQATGSEKWEAHKLMGVGVAMNHNYFVIDCVE